MKLLGPAAVTTLGLVLGVAIWKLSPTLGGHVEPWDAKGYYYVVSLFLAGALATLPSPRWFALAAVGVAAGQCAWIAHVRDGPLWPLGMILAAGFSYVSGLGGWFMLKLVGRPRVEKD